MLHISRREEDFDSLREKKRVNKDFWTQVRSACSKGDIDLLKFLMRSTDIYVFPDEDTNICLYLAIKGNHPDMVEFLLSPYNSKYKIPSHLVMYSFKTKNPEIVKHVIDRLKEEGTLLKHAGMLYELADYLFEYDTDNPDVRKIYLLVRDMWDDAEDPKAVWDESLREQVLSTKGFLGRDSFSVDPISMLKSAFEIDWPEPTLNYWKNFSSSSAIFEEGKVDDFIEMFTKRYGPEKTVELLRSYLPQSKLTLFASRIMEAPGFFEKDYLIVIEGIMSVQHQLKHFLNYLLEGATVYENLDCVNYFYKTVKKYNDDIDFSVRDSLYINVFTFPSDVVLKGLIILYSAKIEPPYNLYNLIADNIEDEKEATKIYAHLMIRYNMYPATADDAVEVLIMFYYNNIEYMLEPLIKHIEERDWESAVLYRLIHAGANSIAYKLINNYWTDLNFTFEFLEEAYEYGDRALVDLILSRMDKDEVERAKKLIFDRDEEE